MGDYEELYKGGERVPYNHGCFKVLLEKIEGITLLPVVPSFAGYERYIFSIEPEGVTLDWNMVQYGLIVRLYGEQERRDQFKKRLEQLMEDEEAYIKKMKGYEATIDKSVEEIGELRERLDEIF